MVEIIGIQYPPPQICRGLRGVKQISAGLHHFCALTREENLFTWGIGRNGELGLGTSVISTDTPIEIPNLSGVKTVCCGSSHTIALLRNGSVYTWGEARILGFDFWRSKAFSEFYPMKRESRL